MSKIKKSATLNKYDLVAENIHAKELEVKGMKYSYNEYDAKGNETLEIKYNAKGRIEEKYKNAYDDNGFLIEEITYLDGKEIAEHKTYERDEKGVILKAFKHYQDDSKDTLEYKYDENGLLLEVKTIDSYGEVEATEISEYENGKLILKEKHEYDELMEKDTYQYDDNGNVIENEHWTEEAGTVRFANSFDDRNNLIESLIYNKKGDLVSKSVYTYNDQNKIVTVIEEAPGVVNTTEIAYDDHGNAIKQEEKNKESLINNSVIRTFNENNDVVETTVFIDLHGRGVNQNYTLKFEYEYYD
jgi:antitoxin component YwqK of YwqJK toxin-antitoxin module